MRGSRWARLAVAVALAAVAAGARAESAAGTEASDAPATVDISFAAGDLTAHLVDAPITDVLDEVSRQTGATIHGEVKNFRSVTVDFEAVPLPDALNRLLVGENFVLVYGRDGGLRSLRLLGGADVETGGARRVVAGSAPVAAGITAKVASPAEGMAAGQLLQMLARHAPVPVSGQLAAALGVQEAPIMNLVNTSLSNDDPSIRAQALGATLNAIESDAEVRAALVQSVKGIDDSQLATIISHMGPHGEEFLLRAQAQARTSELRAKASAVLRRYREQSSADDS